MTDSEDLVDRIVQQARQQRPDLDSSAIELLTRLTRVGRLIETRTRASLEPFGLGIGAFWLLVTLRRSGPPYRLTPAQLIANSTVTPGAISQQLGALETRGLLTRHTHPDDRRARMVGLTDTGLDLIDRAWTAHIENDGPIFDVLGAGGAAQITSLLRRIEAEIQSDAGDSIDTA